MNKLNFSLSPCPNDTFAFYYFIHKSPLSKYFNFSFYDIEKLNADTLKKKNDISKVSFHLFSYLTDSYDLLSSGIALGDTGPLLVSHNKENNFINKTIAIPGYYTTANFLLKSFLKENYNKNTIEEVLFSVINQKIKNKVYDVGLLIHESRFSYKNYNLYCLEDLGQWWQKLTSCPIPLGGIIIKKSLEKEFKIKLCQEIRFSILWAKKNKNNYALKSFIKKYASELDDEIINKHIETYVNEETIQLSRKGEEAIKKLFSYAKKYDLIPNNNTFQLIK